MKVSHKNHYEKIGTFILCYPYNLALTRFTLKKINYKKMLKQYTAFTNLLINEGAKLIFLNPIYGPNQVFTRDIGFAIEDILFICKLGNKKRKEEIKALKEYIKDKNIKYYEMHNEIEGGDVLIYKEYIFVGVSTRTSFKGIVELKKYLKKEGKKYNIIPIRFNKEKMLHLDCVFNILDDDDAIICDYVYDKYIIERIIKNLYYIDKKTARKLGTNIISLGEKRIVTSDKKVEKILKRAGFKVFYLNYSEIIKAGGGFTCSTLPIFRE